MKIAPASFFEKKRSKKSYLTAKRGCPLYSFLLAVTLCMSLSLLDALQITEDVMHPFQIKFVTLDKSRKTGGELIELTNAVRVGSKHNMKENDIINVKQIDSSHHPHIVHTHLILEVNHQEIFI
jgi:hypothetical protein